MCIITGPLRNFEGYVKTVDRHRWVAKLEVPIFGHFTPTEVGFGVIKRVNEEEFRCMIKKNMQEYREKSQEEPGIMILENLLCRKKTNTWKTNIVIIFVMVMHMENIYM